MVYGNSKRIVVVKDIPSNIIEEAIFILKHEPGKEGEETRNISVGKKPKMTVTTDLLLKEAECIINSYINENKLLERYGDNRKVTITKKPNAKTLNWLINSGLIVSVALLIFVVSRFF